VSLERHRPVGGDAEQLVDHRAAASKHRGDLADEPDLFAAQKAATLDEHDGGVDHHRWPPASAASTA